MKKHVLFLCTLFLFSTPNYAQIPGEITQNFGGNHGFNSAVYVLEIQADGKILVGGGFTTYKGVAESRIIRLNTDGTKDTSFLSGTGLNGEPKVIKLQPDGKILVAGFFSSYNGVPEENIIRLNTDGTKDTSFDPGTGFDDTVFDIELQADGKIIVGGNFDTYNGTTENKIIRLNANGTKDTSFITGTGFVGFGNWVSKIELQADGKIILGGNFTNYNGVAENRIIRLNTDGTKDTSFNSGTGFNSYPTAIKQLANGKIIVAGIFTTYNGATENRIIRLNANGTNDTSFNSGTGFNSSVSDIGLQADGKIILGGNFASYNGVTEDFMIRLNTDGTRDTSFNTVGTGFGNPVAVIKQQADGKFVVGGDYFTFNGFTEHRIIRLNSDGAPDATFNTKAGFSGNIFAVEQQTDSKILVGGDFTWYRGLTQNRIIRLNTDGSKDTSFNPGTGFNSAVYDIEQQPDGKILVGGLFTSYKGLTENRIIRLNTDGSKDTSFNSGGTGFNENIRVIKLQPDGKILVGGVFTSYNGAPENFIIRLNSDGSKDTSFTTGTGFDDLVITIELQTDGKILVGGQFTSYNGVTKNKIIRLNTDGTTDASFNIGTGATSGFNSNVNAIEQQADGKIIVGGVFTSYYNGVNDNKIIRLNTNGTQDTSFNPGTSFNNNVSAIELEADGKIIVGGFFTAFNGVTENRIIRLNTNGTKDASFITGTGFDNVVFDIEQQTNGQILVGGGFLTYNGSNQSPYLIELHSDITLGTTSFDDSNEVLIYPNPAHDVLQIQTLVTTSLLSVKIYDLQGKLILEDTKETINVSDLSNGLYIVKVTTEKGEMTKKFIKK